MVAAMVMTVAASSRPHIRVTDSAARTLSFAFSEKGELQMTQLVDGQHRLLWESVPGADKACEVGVPLLVAMLSPERPYVYIPMPVPVPEKSDALTLSLHYNSDTEPVYSVSLPGISGADAHIMRMFRLLCMSSPYTNMPW